jgi:uncharacterized protein (DUF983 family)
LFIEKNPWVYSSMLDMPDNCPVCNQDFKIEPGFYIGALWTSYPIVVLVGIILFVLLSSILNLSFFPVAFIIAISLIVLQPPIMRWGRSIWIGITVKYDEEFEKNN